jgi:hypothetical protein
MKFKMMMLISAALLVTSVSAYAEGAKNTKEQTLTKASLSEFFTQQNSKELASILNEVKQEKEQSTTNETPAQYCKGNQYCLDILLLFNIFAKEEITLDKFKTLLSAPNLSKDYKQALYQIKFSFSIGSMETYKTVLLFESSKILQMIPKANKIELMLKFIKEIPLTQKSFNIIKEEVTYPEVVAFIKTLPQNIPVCTSLDLDMHKYNKNNFCVISNNI